MTIINMLCNNSVFRVFFVNITGKFTCDKKKV